MAEPFVPEPEDRLARREAAASEPRVDNVVEPPPGERSSAGARPWERSGPTVREEAAADGATQPQAPLRRGRAVDEPAAATPVAAAAAAAAPASGPGAPDAGRAPVPFEDTYEEPDDDGYEYYRPTEEPRRSGSGPLIICALVVLAVLALLGGGLLSRIIAGGAAKASPTASATVVASATALPSPTPAPSASGQPSGTPATFADGFTAEIQPCASEPQGPNGCDSSGTTVSSGEVWAWVGFTKGTASDTLGVTLVDKAGASQGDASRDLASIGCQQTCNGWIKVRFSGLTPGTYKLRVNRNGTAAGETSFTVR